MPEQILVSQAIKDAQAVKKKTIQQPTAIKAAPLEDNQTFKQGTNLAGSTIKDQTGADYQLKGASSGVPASPTAPETPAVPESPATPTPTTPAAPNTTTTTPETPAKTVPGLDEAALLASGVSQEQIDRMKQVINPQIANEATLKQNAEDQRDQTVASLEEEQAMVENAYAGIKDQKTALATEQQNVINDSSRIQKEISEQARQKELFDNAQAQKKYDLEQSKNLRETQKQQADLEHSLARTLSASMGVAFSFTGMARAAEFQQNGIRMISDLQSQTAYGDAEFSFRAMDIDRDYTNKINAIEVERKNGNVQVLSQLSNDLQSIDEKILVSAQDKKKEAREAVNSYFDKKNKIDQDSADLVSKANDTLFTEADKIKKEKEEKEAVDIAVSQSLGYFANKFGTPVNKDGNGNPKAFVGDFDKDLSSQFGHLVDKKGNAILGANGQQIAYVDPEISEFNKALEAYSNGTSTGYDESKLNESIGANNYLKTAVKDGSYGGQCGTFVRSKFTTESGWETECVGANATAACSINAKKKMVDTRGFKLGAGKPKVSDVVIFTGAGYGSVGHYAMINEISADGKTATLTESNMDLKGTVHTTRKIDLTNKAIYGFFTPKLKQDVINQQPHFSLPGGDISDTPEQTETTEQRKANPLLDVYVGSISQYEKLQGSKEGRATLQGLAKVGLTDDVIRDYFSKGPSGEDGKPDFVMEDGRVDWSKIDPEIVKNTTAEERKSASTAVRLADANYNLQAYEDAGIDSSKGQGLIQNLGKGDSNFMNSLTELANQNLLTPQEIDIMRQRSQWIAAKLRKESGASISNSEYIRESDNFFPKSGASELDRSNLAEKRRREEILFLNEAGLATQTYDAYTQTRKPYQIIIETNRPVDSTFKNATDAVSGTVGGLQGWWKENVEPTLNSAEKTISQSSNNFAEQAKKTYNLTNQAAQAEVANLIATGKFTEDQIKAYIKQFNLQ